MIWARIRARNAVTSVQVSRRLTFAIRAPFDKSSRITYNENCRPSCTWQTPPQPTLLKDTSFKELPKPPRCRFYADVAYEELETYSRDDLTKLSRKQLQYICKVLGINQGIKSTLMIQKISEHMDQNDLPKLAFVPFQNNFKPKWEYQHKINPLSIKLPSIEAKRFGRIYQGVYPSVTTILSHTQSDETIKQLAYWGSKEVEKMGQENFDKMVQETMESGSNFHQLLAGWLLQYHEFMSKDREEFSKNFSIFRTKEQEIERRHDFIMQTHQFALAQKGGVHSLLFKQCQSFYDVFRDIENVVAVESGVSHGLLRYAGTVDCIATFRGKLCLIDWKTSKRKRKTLKSCHDYPVQLAAYAAAANADPAYDFEITNVALVFVYDDGSPADVHMLTLEQCLPYYYSWLGRLRLFRQNVGNIQTEGLSPAVTSDVTVKGDQTIDQKLEASSSEKTALLDVKQGKEKGSTEYDRKDSSDTVNDFYIDNSIIGMDVKLRPGEQNHKFDIIDLASQPVNQCENLESRSSVTNSKPQCEELLYDQCVPNRDSTEEIIDVKTSLNLDFDNVEDEIAKGEIVNKESYCIAKPTIHEPRTERPISSRAYQHPDLIERGVSMETRPHSEVKNFAESIGKKAIVDVEAYCKMKSTGNELLNDDLMTDRMDSPHSAAEIIQIETSPKTLVNTEHDIEYMERMENAASLACDGDGSIESIDDIPDSDVCFDDEELVKIVPQTSEMPVGNKDHKRDEHIESSWEDSEPKSLAENSLPPLNHTAEFKSIVLRDDMVGLAHDKNYQQAVSSACKERNGETFSNSDRIDSSTLEDAFAGIENQYTLLHESGSTMASFQDVLVLDSNYHFTNIELFSFEGKDVFDFLSFTCSRIVETVISTVHDLPH